MITRSLGKDQLTGLETIHHYDEVTGKTHIEHRQDVSGIIERNKELQKTDHQKVGIKNEWMHAASIPEIVQIQWMQKYGITDIYNEEYWPLIKKLLNSADYRYLRVGNARI
jgi:hypothetical protein